MKFVVLKLQSFRLINKNCIIQYIIYLNKNKNRKFKMFMDIKKHQKPCLEYVNINISISSLQLYIFE